MPAFRSLHQPIATLHPHGANVPDGLPAHFSFYQTSQGRQFLLHVFVAIPTFISPERLPPQYSHIPRTRNPQMFFFDKIPRLLGQMTHPTTQTSVCRRLLGLLRRCCGWISDDIFGVRRRAKSRATKVVRTTRYGDERRRV